MSVYLRCLGGEQSFLATADDLLGPTIKGDGVVEKSSLQVEVLG